MPVVKIIDNATDVMASLADVLANWPLYRPLHYTIADPQQIGRESYLYFPRTITQYCAHANCEDVTIWESFHDPGADLFGQNERLFTCRHCKQFKTTFYYFWHRQLTIKNEDIPAYFVKIGQYPAMEELIPRELVRTLDQSDLSLYRKSVRCRNQGMGLGAISYLRRVVENKINIVLDDVADEAAKYGFQLEQLKRLDEAKTSWKFSEKIKYASVILPPSLRPGGHNPIDQLHDLASEGVHYSDDEEALLVYDECRPVFEYLFREIDARRRSAAEYAQQLAKLATNRKSKNP
jgi:hypothetical protein